VIGDLMLDRFVWGSVSRISPEAPVPVVLLERETAMPGGAGNVVRNIAALGGRALPIGVRGDDQAGDALERLFEDAGVPREGLVVARGRPTTVKTRVMAHQQQIVRIDREEDGEHLAETRAALRERSLERLGGVQAVVVSDYDKGAITPDLLQAILPEAARRGLPAIIDPKIRNFPHYRPATVVTPNSREAMEAAGAVARSDQEFEALGRTLVGRLGLPHLLITRGDAGMLLVDRAGRATRIPAEAREVFDVAGAGDTVTAALALALAAGADILEAARLANLAAGVVVGKVGTASLSAAELVGAARRTRPMP
jgi:D-beta-D-heptose 7-phosphate kinase/D-beta-D-heptose 1-phosphate adenosyltransferase